MRAAVYHRFGPPEVVQIEERPDPEPGPSDVLLDVHAASVTAADAAARSGEPKVFRPLAFGWPRPRNPILGAEVAGVIAAVGADVTTFAVGDRVTAATGVQMSGHAERIALPADGAIVPIPEGIPAVQAVAVNEGALTALPFLRDHGRVEKGMRVLVNGAAGAVGSAAVQLAADLGAEVTGTCSPDNAELVASLGAHHVADHTAVDIADGPARFDVVFDAVGKRSYRELRGVLNDGGRYLTTVPDLAILRDVLWTRTFGRRHRATFAATGLRKPAAKVEDLTHLMDLVAQGRFAPVVSDTKPLDEIADAYRVIDTGHKRGSIVLDLIG